MAEAGAVRAYGGRTVNVKGHQDRYWIVRNKEKWIGASHADVSAHLLENSPRNKDRKF